MKQQEYTRKLRLEKLSVVLGYLRVYRSGDLRKITLMERDHPKILQRRI